ncbi:MAG: glycosyltransferase family 4 protein [Burkholderiaceae bacterium]|nr:glycosyltransferase family 4 protein [Burkholderiaceae bacterium]
MNRITFVVPGDLATPSGGYAYDRRLIAELQSRWQIDVVSLGDGFPQPSAEQRAAALARLESLRDGIPVVVDGLALGALPEAAQKIARRAPLVALVHHPLALETGLSPADARKLFDSECKALAAARSVIVTSRATAKRLSDDYDVEPQRITVAAPGTDRAAPAEGSADGTLRLLSVGAVVPRKGFDVLIAALASIAELPWRLTVAGDLARAPATVSQLQADIARHGLAGRVNLLGAVSPQRLGALYQSADLFVLASHFEGYGMAYAEAMAHGLPIIGTTGGATVDTVPPTAGVLVEPGNVNALSRALRMVIENEGERRRLARGARAAAADLPSWETTARIVASALERLS